MGKVLDVKIILISITLLPGFLSHGKTNVKYRELAESTSKNQILETVVQMRVYALSSNSRIDNAGQVRINSEGDLEKVIETEYKVSNGLGTLVSLGNERIIVTHNHWGNILAEMIFVRFFNTNGDLLLQMESDEFKNLIRSQDNGTLVLKAPGELNSIPSTRVVDSSFDQKIISTDPVNAGKPKEGDIVFFAYRKSGARDKVEILEGYIESTGVFEGVAILEVRVLNGSIIRNGNSGGGVWFEGQFIGNVWATEVKRGWSWDTFQFEDSLTNVSYVAPFDPASLYAIGD